MPSTCALAPEAQITAFFVPGSPSVEPRLYVSARGTLSDSCGVVTIHRSPLRIWPPEFALEEYKEGDVCSEVLTPYAVTQDFSIGSAPATVTVHDAVGAHAVTVEVVPDAAESLAGPALDTGEAIGVSIGRASLSEAMADAAAQLYAGQHPNEPRKVRAIEITYSSGGILPPVLSVRADMGS
jgi:hypothetical protein